MAWDAVSERDADGNDEHCIDLVNSSVRPTLDEFIEI
jgi:hypothetical protein